MLTLALGSTDATAPERSLIGSAQHGTRTQHAQKKGRRAICMHGQLCTPEHTMSQMGDGISCLDIGRSR